MADAVATLATNDGEVWVAEPDKALDAVDTVGPLAIVLDIVPTFVLEWPVNVS